MPLITNNVSKYTSTSTYLHLIGVPELPPLTCPFDPGYDSLTFESHLIQSSHLMSSLKISMACWMIANEVVTRQKIAVARAHNVPIVTGGSPFEIAVVQGQLEAYLDLCADLGVTRIECGEGFTVLSLDPHNIVRLAHEKNLTVQFEIGKKHDGAFTSKALDQAIQQGRIWLNAGAEQLVVEARESACAVGMFNDDGIFNASFADQIADTFGLDRVIFEAPNKSSQFTLLEHFGPLVQLGNIRLEELLRVEIFRRGLHSDAFDIPKLRPIRDIQEAGYQTRETMCNDEISNNYS